MYILLESKEINEFIDILVQLVVKALWHSLKAT